jgi:hypothetical protein
MKEVLIIIREKDDGIQKAAVAFDVQNAFIYRGEKLRDCPEWMQDLLEEGNLCRLKAGGIHIKYKNGYQSAYPGDLIIQHSPDEYSIVRSVTNENLLLPH